MLSLQRSSHHLQVAPHHQHHHHHHHHQHSGGHRHHRHLPEPGADPTTSANSWASAMVAAAAAAAAAAASGSSGSSSPADKEFVPASVFAVNAAECGSVNTVARSATPTSAGSGSGYGSGSGDENRHHRRSAAARDLKADQRQFRKGSVPFTGRPRAPLRSDFGLQLPEDPRTWLREDVQTWIRYMADVHSLPTIQADRFLMNGKALCLMTMEMFCQRVPLGGKMLYKDFQLRLSTAMYSPTSG